MSFMKQSAISACAFGLMAVTVWAGERELQVADDGVFVVPKRIQRIHKLADGTIVRGPWREYVAPNNGAEAVFGLAFDNYNPDTVLDDGSPIGADTGCALAAPSSRYFFGATFCNPRVAGDMTVEPGAEGTLSSRIHFAWNWEVGGSGTSEQCLVDIFTYEDFDDTGAGPAVSGAFPGVALDFDILDSSSTPPGGYYFTDVDITGIELELPADGSGAYTLDFLTDDGLGGVTLATCAQPMLWGVSTPGFPDEGFQGPLQWDDDTDVLDGSATCAPPDCTDLDLDLVCDNLPDGLHAAGCELYDYSAVVPCPDPLGAMFAAYSDFTTGPQLTISCPTPGLAGVSNTFEVTGATPGATIAWVIGTAGGSTPMPAPCLGDTVDLSGASLAFTAVADASGVATFIITIPSSFAGSSVDLQAVEVNPVDTCPKTAVVSCAIF